MYGLFEAPRRPTDPFEESAKTVPTKPRYAKRVIRKHKLVNYFGQPTQNEAIIKELEELGLIHFYSMSPGGRSQCADEDEIADIQAAAREAGSLRAYLDKVRAERGR
jgi:hypothetical protein